MSKQVIEDGFYNVFYMFELFEHKNTRRDMRSYIELLKNLADTNLVISSETQEKEVDFMPFFYQELKNRKETYRNKKIKKEAAPAYIARDIKQVAEKPSVTIHPNMIEIEDDLDDELEVSQVLYLNQLVVTYQLEETHTGLATKNYKNRFLLFPAKVVLQDNTSMYLGVYLTIFKHGFAMLQITTQLNNIDIDGINSTMWDLAFKRVYMPEFLFKNNESLVLSKKARCNDIADIIKVYNDYIHKQTGYTIGYPGINFYNLSISKCTDQPNDYSKGSNISDRFKQDIYKLLFSPIHEHNLKPKDEIDDIISKKFFSFSNNFRLYAASNRSISAYTKKFLSHFEEKDSEELNIICQNTSIGGIINAIEILLLKRITQLKYFVYELNDLSSLKSLIQLNINENTNYIHEFSRFFYVYGTVRELTEFLNEACEEFMQNNLVNERKTRIEKLINLKKERYVANFSVLGAILTVAITLILSLPTLEQLIKLLGIDNSKLLPTYITVNSIFILVVLFVARDQVSENFKRLNYITFPKVVSKYYKYSTYLYLKFYSFFYFIDTDVKIIFKSIINKLKSS
ncbi:hypothetical protein [Bacillus sp. RAR_GA_16]|uniref:hypothetical protein n=1 Tax=Bacillus sp. RAR_GA_16 TaxID=2876774 RepID=UPI001CCE7877|nr:hypothetical protein [Bacillus sp. RAR_GA_16]MCA0174565.1 hypothetical protein [Bacillus sp. RAR_GA_16]